MSAAQLEAIANQCRELLGRLKATTYEPWCDLSPLACPTIPPRPQSKGSWDLTGSATTRGDELTSLAEQWSQWRAEWQKHAAAVRRVENLAQFFNSIEISSGPNPPPTPDPAAEFELLVSSHVDGLWDAYRRRPHAYVDDDVADLFRGFYFSRKRVRRFRGDEARVQSIIRLIREGDQGGVPK
jgi:hypothetical protein